MSEILKSVEGKTRYVRRTVNSPWPNSPPIPAGEEFLTGVDLHMRDGTRWFHPYDGSPPFQIPKEHW